MKLILGIVLQLSVFAAFAGGEVGNGGDGNEIRFVEIANDLRSWIIKGGPQYLKFPAGIQVTDYILKCYPCLFLT